MEFDSHKKKDPFFFFRFAEKNESVLFFLFFAEGKKKGMQDLEQAKIGLILQKKLHERFNLLYNIEKCVPSEIIAEIDSWMEPITTNQQEPLKSNMRGKKLSGINYISKLLSDFFLDGDLFKKSYEPHLSRPFLNYLLQKKLEVTDHFSFSSFSLRENERENEREFLIKVLSLADAILKKKTITKMYEFEDKNNFALYSLNNFLKRVGTSNFSKAIEILKNPLANPNCSLTSFSSFSQSEKENAKKDGEGKKEEEEKYVEHLVPDAQLSSTFLSGLKTVYFLKN